MGLGRLLELGGVFRDGGALLSLLLVEISLTRHRLIHQRATCARRRTSWGTGRRRFRNRLRHLIFFEVDHVLVWLGRLLLLPRLLREAPPATPPATLLRRAVVARPAQFSSQSLRRRDKTASGLNGSRLESVLLLRFANRAAALGDLTNLLVDDVPVDMTPLVRVDLVEQVNELFLLSNELTSSFGRNVFQNISFIGQYTHGLARSDYLLILQALLSIVNSNQMCAMCAASVRAGLVGHWRSLVLQPLAPILVYTLFLLNR